MLDNFFAFRNTFGGSPAGQSTAALETQQDGLPLPMETTASSSAPSSAAPSTQPTVTHASSGSSARPGSGAGASTTSPRLRIAAPGPGRLAAVLMEVLGHSQVTLTLNT